MLTIEMSDEEMRRYLKYFRGEERAPKDWLGFGEFDGPCWQAEAIIASSWKRLTEGFQHGISPEGVTIEQSIIDWVEDVVSRHCPYSCEDDMETYVTGKFYRDNRGFVYRILGFAKKEGTEEIFVVYKEMFDEGVTWIRTCDSFFRERVEMNNETVPRFRVLTDEDGISSVPYWERKRFGIQRFFHNILRPDYTPETITELREDEVFVFGSNLEGRHSGGAARTALEKFGAKWGQGVGLQGQSYAIPTMHGGQDSISVYVKEFINFAKRHQDLLFYVTRIGCGIAGYADEDIAVLFKGARGVENIVLPRSFVEAEVY